MAKQVKTKVFQTVVKYQYFNKQSGEVENAERAVTGAKVTEAKAEKLAKDEVKFFNSTADKNAKRLFLKVTGIEKTVSVWAMDYDEFLKFAYPIEE